MLEYEDFEGFCRAVLDELPDEWDTEIDEVDIEQSDGRRAGFMRDDRCTFILEVPHDEEWRASNVRAHIPTVVGAIPDRPGQPLDAIEPPTVDATVDHLEDKLPEYEGTFTYDDED